MDENVQSMIGKFSNDSKVDYIIDSEDGYQKLQWNLGQLGKLAKNG